MLPRTTTARRVEVRAASLARGGVLDAHGVAITKRDNERIGPRTDGLLDAMPHRLGSSSLRIKQYCLTMRR